MQGCRGRDGQGQRVGEEVTLAELEAHARLGQQAAEALAAASPEADRSFILATAKRFEVAADNAKLQREFLELRAAKAKPKPGS